MTISTRHSIRRVPAHRSACPSRYPRTISPVTSFAKHNGAAPPSRLQALRFPHRDPLLAVLYGHGQFPEYAAIDSSIKIFLICASDSGFAFFPSSAKADETKSNKPVTSATVLIVSD
jgi:hypothetical protein